MSTESLPRRRVVLIFVSLMLGMFMSALNQMMLSTALPTIVGDLGGADQIALVLTVYLLAMTTTMPVYGRLGDRWGRRPLLLTALATFTVGSVLGALSPNMTVLIAARVLQGFGGGGLIILSQATIADVVPARDRGKFMGIIGSVWAVSSVAGPLLGGWLTEGPGWRWTFAINIPLGVITLIATFVLLRLPAPAEKPTGRIDLAGIALLVVTTTSLVMLSTWGGTQFPWVSVTSLVLAVVAVVGAVAFVRVELAADEPILPMSLFADRTFRLTTIGAAILGVAMFGAFGYLPTYLQMSAGIDAAEAGLLMSPIVGTMLVTSYLSGWFVSRTGRYKWFPVISMALTSYGLYAISNLGVTDDRMHIATTLAILGAGIGLGSQILVLIVQLAVPHRIVGTATAATNFFRQIGATLGSALVGGVFTARLFGMFDTRLPDAPFTASEITPEIALALPEPTRSIVLEAYADALLPIFGALVPLTLFAAVILAFVRERSLD